MELFWQIRRDHEFEGLSVHALWAAIEQKVGPSHAARQMVDVLLLIREHDAAAVEIAVRGALAAGAHDGRAVAVLTARAQRATAARLERLDDRLSSRDALPVIARRACLRSFQAPIVAPGASVK